MEARHGRESKERLVEQRVTEETRLLAHDGDEPRGDDQHGGRHRGGDGSGGSPPCGGRQGAPPRHPSEQRHRHADRALGERREADQQTGDGRPQPLGAAQPRAQEAVERPGHQRRERHVEDRKPPERKHERRRCHHKRAEQRLA